MDTTTFTDDGALVTENDQRRFRIRPRHILGWLLVGISLFAASAALGGSDSAVDAQQTNDGILFGAFARTQGNQTQIEAYQELERQLGAKLQIARTFSTWERSAASLLVGCLLYTSPSPRDQRGSRMPSSA